MAIFHNCPVCGVNATVKPELADNNNRVFRCENGHRFKITIEKQEKVESQNIWDHMPEWARTLNKLHKNSYIEV